MSWLFQVLARRAAAQSGVLAAVVALTIVTSALLGTFSVLLTTAQDDALSAALGDSSADEVDLVADVRLGGFTNTPQDAGAAVEATTAALSGLVAEAKGTTSSVWPQTAVLQTATDLDQPFAYLAAVPHQALVRVTQGSIPAPDASFSRSDDGTPVVPVAVPVIAADGLGWGLGDRIALGGTNDRGRVTAEVTGIYELTGPPSSWSNDLLEGAGFTAGYPLPESMGSVKVQVWGPLLAPEAALLDGTVAAASARVTVTPDLTGLTRAEAAAMGDRLVDGQAVLSSAVDDLTLSARLDTRVDDTLAGVAARIAATGTGVLVAALVLAMSGGAALLLASRLLSEQRTSGRVLMAARGVSRRQHVAVSALEAASIAVVAALTAPWLSALVVTALSTVVAPAGEVPSVRDVLGEPALWWTCALGAAALAVLLVIPALRSTDDEDVPATRPGRAAAVRAAFARSGGTLALLGIAGVATWQLASYGTMPADGGTDPVLVAAPTLLVLACALLAARSLPLLARATDAGAARSRRLVGPLAVWETGRRPGRAAGTVLLVAVAVAGGTFAQVTLTTWRASQIDQAELAVGTDVRLSDVPGSPLDAADQVAAVEDGTAASLHPVMDRNASFGRPGDDSAPWATRLLAVDDGDLLRGRLTTVAGLGSASTWSDVVAQVGTDEAPAPFLPLPAGTERITAHLGATAEPQLAGSVRVDVVVEDSRGVRAQRPLGRFRLGESVPAEVTLRDDGPVDDAARVVGFRVTMSAQQGADVAEWVGEDVTLRVEVEDLTAVDVAGETTAVPYGDIWAARPRGSSASAEAVAEEVRQGLVAASSADGRLRLTRQTSAVAFSLEGAEMVAAPAETRGTFPGTRATPGDQQPLPAVMTADLARSAAVEPGDLITLRAPAPVEVQVVGVVETLPGHSGSGILMSRASLQSVELAVTDVVGGPDAWWGTAPDVSALTTAASDVGELRTTEEEREIMLAGPARVGFQTAMWLLTAATLLLAGVGVASSVAAGLSLRRLELARLQALGVPRRTLVRAVLAEQGILGAVGLTGGVAAGILTGALLAPALAVGPDGQPPVPDAVLAVPWPAVGVLCGAVLAVLGLATAIMARVRVRQASAALLRLGADR